MVRLDQQGVWIYLSEQGRVVLQTAGVQVPESRTTWFVVKESDTLGIWAYLPREDGMHILLIRWEYIFAVDLPEGEVRTEGFLN
jgi:hypothetical protein